MGQARKSTLKMRQFIVVGRLSLKYHINLAFLDVSNKFAQMFQMDAGGHLELFNFFIAGFYTTNYSPIDLHVLSAARYRPQSYQGPL